MRLFLPDKYIFFVLLTNPFFMVIYIHKSSLSYSRLETMSHPEGIQSNDLFAELSIDFVVYLLEGYILDFLRQLVTV